MLRTNLVPISNLSIRFKFKDDNLNKINQMLTLVKIHYLKLLHEIKSTKWSYEIIK